MRTFIKGNKKFTEISTVEFFELNENETAMILLTNEETQEKELGFFKIEEVS